jgi:hypothetical protein
MENVRNWFQTYKNAIHRDEQSYINEESDLIALNNAVKSPLHLLSEKSRLIKTLFRKQPRVGQIDVPNALFWSEKRIAGFSDAIIIFLGLAMLFGPLWWLNWVKHPTKMLGIITGFAAVFAVGLRLVSLAKPFEVLGATAA